MKLVGVSLRGNGHEDKDKEDTEEGREAELKRNAREINETSQKR